MPVLPNRDFVLYFVQVQPQDSDKGKLVKYALVTVVVLGVCLNGYSAIVQIPADQPTIQSGVDFAAAGDTLVVADGVYSDTGNVNIDFGGKNLYLVSETGPASTIIDIAGAVESPRRGFFFHSGEDSTATVEGFTLRGGYVSADTNASWQHGGAVACVGNSSPTFRNCIFEDNFSEVYGGAVYSDSSAVRIVGCAFNNNVSAWGGAVACLWRYEDRIDSSTFDGNFAEVQGGAIYCRWPDSIAILDCSFVSNSSGNSGGAIKAFYATIDLADSYFYGNYANRGGAMDFDNSFVGISGCVFDSNLAFSAETPATRLSDSLNVNPESRYVRHSIVDHSLLSRTTPFGTLETYSFNRADLNHGGAIYGSASYPFPIENCTFRNNSAQVDGGGIRLISGPLTIDACQFIGNSCGRDGGGAWIFSIDVDLTNCAFESNQAVAGASLLLIDSEAEVTSCTFRGNHAANWGGGIVSDNCSVIITGSLFHENRIDSGTGNGVFLNQSSTDLVNCTMAGNFGGAGGLVACWESSPHISNSILAFSVNSRAVDCLDSSCSPVLSCTDIFGNDNGDWTDCIGDQADNSGNLNVDPMFCHFANGDFFIRDQSPCLAENNGCSVLIGALGAGCLPCCLHRGNANGLTGPNGPVDIADLTFLVEYLYQGGAMPLCEEEGNIDGLSGGAGKIDVADLTYLVDYLFKGGPQPPECS